MTTSDFAIQTTGLTKYFGSKKAVDSLTLAVPRGSVYAFLGRNGSGKTTTIRMLLGFLRPTSGTSTVLGADSRSLSPGMRGRIGYMAESQPLHDWMTVAQEGEFAASFHTSWNSALYKSTLDYFGLSGQTRVRSLSRGQRTGLSLAITMAPEPELLILDDPAIGLDPVARHAVLETVLRKTVESGRTVLFSSHLLDDVERVADHAAVLDYSRLRIAGPIEELASALCRFRLAFAPGTVPRSLPEIRGVLSVKRFDDALVMVVVRPDGETRAGFANLNPLSVDERPVSFSDAVMTYMGPSGNVEPSLHKATAGAGGGVR